MRLNWFKKSTLPRGTLKGQRVFDLKCDCGRVKKLAESGFNLFEVGPYAIPYCGKCCKPIERAYMEVWNKLRAEHTPEEIVQMHVDALVKHHEGLKRIKAIMNEDRASHKKKIRDQKTNLKVSNLIQNWDNGVIEPFNDEVDDECFVFGEWDSCHLKSEEELFDVLTKNPNANQKFTERVFANHSEYWDWCYIKKFTRSFLEKLDIQLKLTSDIEMNKLLRREMEFLLERTKEKNEQSTG